MPIETGRALAGLAPMAVRTANSVFRGDILLADGSIRRAFIKDLDARQLANELLIATLAHKLDVRVPRTAIVAVSIQIARNFVKIPHVNGTDFIALGSIDAIGSTVHQIMSLGETGVALETVKSPPDLGKMYCFDTWVANIDRHTNNIVISGDGKPYLIDHGHCFSGPSWTKVDLNPEWDYPNRLKSWLTPCLSDAEKTSAMRDVQDLVGKIASTDIQLAIDDALVEALYGKEDSLALASFLEGRLSHVTPMVARSLGALI